MKIEVVVVESDVRYDTIDDMQDSVLHIPVLDIGRLVQCSNANILCYVKEPIVDGSSSIEQPRTVLWAHGSGNVRQGLS
jgi:hypothetical protein